MFTKISILTLFLSFASTSFACKNIMNNTTSIQKFFGGQNTWVEIDKQGNVEQKNTLVIGVKEKQIQWGGKTLPVTKICKKGKQLIVYSGSKSVTVTRKGSKVSAKISFATFNFKATKQNFATLKSKLKKGERISYTASNNNRRYNIRKQRILHQFFSDPFEVHPDNISNSSGAIDI